MACRIGRINLLVCSVQPERTNNLDIEKGLFVLTLVPHIKECKIKVVSEFFQGKC